MDLQITSQRVLVAGIGPATLDEVAAMIGYACSGLASAASGPAPRVDDGVVRAIA